MWWEKEDGEDDVGGFERLVAVALMVGLKRPEMDLRDSGGRLKDETDAERVSIEDVSGLFDIIIHLNER